MNRNTLKLKYTATITGITLYYSLLLLNIGLIGCTSSHYLHTEFSGFFNHISNFFITSILMSIISLTWLLQGAPFKLIIWLGAIAITLNFVIELFVTVLNTPDITDAVYGTAGAIITVLIMLLIKEIGMKEVVAD